MCKMTHKRQADLEFGIQQNLITLQDQNNDCNKFELYEFASW
jgi:hypothetical protein